MVSLFKIEKNRFLIILFLLISIIIGTIVVFIHLSPFHCYVNGCLAFSLIILPIYPAVTLITSLTIDYPAGILASPTISKFIPIFLIFFNSFAFGLLSTIIFISFQKKLLQEKFSHIHYAALKFSVYFIFWMIIFSAFITLRYPLKPFLSDDQIVSICKTYNYIKSDRNECLINYLVYKLPNCKNKNQGFHYPLKLYTAEADTCLMDNFITEHPFQDIPLRQSWYSSGALKFKGRYPTSQLGTILNFFDPLLMNADAHQKIEFCNSFSSDPVSSNNGRMYSNKDWCVEHLLLR